MVAKRKPREDRVQEAVKGSLAKFHEMGGQVPLPPRPLIPVPSPEERRKLVLQTPSKVSVTVESPGRLMLCEMFTFMVGGMFLGFLLCFLYLGLGK